MYLEFVRKFRPKLIHQICTLNGETLGFNKAHETGLPENDW
jgi:hypothetical protein